MLNLKPCPYRVVDGEGHILCQQIKTGEREVSPAICRACPIAQIDCQHLRATLAQETRLPITVRWGNGKTEIWDDPTPPLALTRAACSAKTIPILSPRDCAGCTIRMQMTDHRSQTPDTLRQTIVSRKPVPIAKRTSQPIPVPQTAPAPAVASIAPNANEPQRQSIVAQKIIQLQEWLAKQKKSSEEETETIAPIAVGARPVRVVGEERRVGWTD